MLPPTLRERASSFDLVGIGLGFTGSLWLAAASLYFDIDARWILFPVAIVASLAFVGLIVTLVGTGSGRRLTIARSIAAVASVVVGVVSVSPLFLPIMLVGALLLVVPSVRRA